MDNLRKIAFGMALFCIVAGIAMIGMHIGKAGQFLVPGLALVVVGLAAGNAARSGKPS